MKKVIIRNDEGDFTGYLVLDHEHPTVNSTLPIKKIANLVGFDVVGYCSNKELYESINIIDPDVDTWGISINLGTTENLDTLKKALNKLEEAFDAQTIAYKMRDELETENRDLMEELEYLEYVIINQNEPK